MGRADFYLGGSLIYYMLQSLLIFSCRLFAVLGNMSALDTFSPLAYFHYIFFTC